MSEDGPRFEPKQVNRFAYFFLTPWWRLVWFVLALIWCAALNLLFISGGGSNEWIGAASVIPLIAFVVDQFIRDGRLRK